MRDYSKVGPKFWIGATGKRLRSAGMEAQIVAMYLLTSPHANMLGLYYCPTMFIAHETGLGLEGASKGLQSAIEAGFCEYDEASEVVWVVEMASYQIADQLKPNDLRVKGVHNEYMSLPSNPYLIRFFEKYKDAFCMAECRGKTSPNEAPSKPLASQEQEQEQEHITNPVGLVVDSAADDLPAKPAKPDCPHQQIIALYHELLPASPEIRDWTPARSVHLRTRWNEQPERQNLDWWRRFFGYIAQSEFLTGRAHARERKPFCAPLDWICKAENFAKIIEGRYHEEVAA